MTAGPATDCDLAIVGCGIIGVWAAWLARARQQNRRIRVLDRSLIGHGTTLYSPGHLHPYGLTEQQRQLSARSIEHYCRFRAAFPAVLYTDVPLFGIASKASMGEIAQRYVTPGFALLTGAERQEFCRAHAIRLDGGKTMSGGITSGYTSPQQVVQALALDVRQDPNCEIWEGARVADIDPRGASVKLALSDGRTFRAGTVVLAPGAFATDDPVGRFFPDAGIWIKKIVSMHIARAPRPGDPIIYLHDDDSYLMPRPDLGQWIFSFPAPTVRLPSAGTPLTIIEADRQHALDVLGRHFPDLVPFCTGGRVCCDGYTDSLNPVIRAAETQPRLILAAGGSGLGVRLAPAIAERALALAERFLPLWAART